MATTDRKLTPKMDFGPYPYPRPAFDDTLRRFVRSSDIYKNADDTNRMFLMAYPEQGAVYAARAEADQTRLESAIEATINITTGFVISWAVWMWVVAPLFNIPAPVGQALAITALFTVTSLARSYFWRRFFANNIHRRIHQWLKP